LEVELKPVGTDFTGVDAEIVAGPAGASTGTLRVVFPPGTLTRGVSYHWRARFHGTTSATLASAWSDFGGNGDPDGADLICVANTAAPVLSEVALLGEEQDHI